MAKKKTRKKREVVATVRSSNGRKHYDITQLTDGRYDCSCFSQRYKTFKKGATCCKHLAALGLPA